MNHFYADALRSVYLAHSDDLDIIALYAEALMCKRPRRLWDLGTGQPTTNDTVEGRTALEREWHYPVVAIIQPCAASIFI